MDAFDKIEEEAAAHAALPRSRYLVAFDAPMRDVERNFFLLEFLISHRIINVPNFAETPIYFIESTLSTREVYDTITHEMPHCWVWVLPLDDGRSNLVAIQMMANLNRQRSLGLLNEWHIGAIEWAEREVIQNELPGDNGLRDL